MNKELEAILPVFVEEAHDHLDLLDRTLLELEKQPDSQEHHLQLLRSAHSLKGAAATVELDQLAEFAHALEELIDRLHRGQIPNAGAGIELLFQSVDAIRADLPALATGAGAPEIAGMAARLAALLGNAARPEQALGQPGGAAEFAQGEYDKIRIQALRKQGLQVLQADLWLPVDTPDAPEAAFELLRGLRKAWSVVATDPPEGDLGRLDGRGPLRVLVGGTGTPDDLRRELQDLGVSRCACQQLSAEPPAPDRRAAPSARSTIKVDMERIDGLVDLIGELVIVESMVSSAAELRALRSEQLRAHLGQLGKITRDLQDAGLRMRMVALRGTFLRMKRMVRDLARQHGKQIQLILAGEDTEMDRGMLEPIVEAMVHLIRNAVDHGIEPEGERIRTGKPRMGTIHLSAYRQSGGVVLELRDDGRGLDRGRILEKGAELGFVREGQSLSAEETDALIFQPGLSTAPRVTEVSGRGVGLDVVRRGVESMSGRIKLSSRAGEGTCFKLLLPTTMSIIDGMLVACGTERYIIPTLSVLESLRPTRDMLFSHAARYELIHIRGETLPLVRLAALFDLALAPRDPCQSLVVMVEGMGCKFGLLVDDVLAQQQVVIKSLSAGVQQARFFSGAAILSDGHVGLILSVDEIGAMIRRGRSHAEDRTADATGPDQGAPAHGEEVGGCSHAP
ncbi:MAG TPA: chemotaxis protein CheA [Myxococcota bacterium]|nr:chemotaxis protein CheA [Myxococcota bacterium]HRY96254.1 chemotaxis protein CheA [Myxococcota bacterium]HSA20454.1 chemotaxis protein CheA [Myxococcota bacterium]